MAEITQRAEAAGYIDYLSKYLTYPPPPGPFPNLDESPGLDIYGDIISAALLINPAFNIYHILDTVCSVYSTYLSRMLKGFIYLSSHRSCGMSSVSREWHKRTESPIYSQLFPSGTFPDVQVAPVYFNRDDVKAAIHAPANTQWSECASSDVFVNGVDESPGSYLTVLPRVVERSNRTVIVTGSLDFVLLSTGFVHLIFNILPSITPWSPGRVI
jgi:carboxypeptidase D